MTLKMGVFIKLCLHLSCYSSDMIAQALRSLRSRCVFHSHLWYENCLVAGWNDEDARRLAKAQACNVPAAESILNKFEEHGDITYRAQFIDLLLQHAARARAKEKRGI